LLRLLERLADLALRLADILVEELRPLDIEEVPVDFLPALFRELLGQAVRYGLGDHRLAASGRAIEEDALRGPQLVLPVVLGIEVRELHGVFDGLNLRRQTAHVAI